MTNLTAQGAPDLPPPAEWALQIAAQAWCEPTTSDIEMDERLATVFAQHLTKLAAAFEADRQARQTAPEAPRDVTKMVEAVAKAVLGDIHTIRAGQVIVFLDIDKPGRNAFDQLRNRIATAIDTLGALAASEAEAVKVEAPNLPDGYQLLAVKNFAELVEALSRAERKGYMPDAMASEWEAFNYCQPTDLATPTPQAAEPEALVDKTSNLQGSSVDKISGMQGRSAEPVPVEAVSEDTKLLDWLETELQRHGRADFSASAKPNARGVVYLFTVSSQHVKGDFIRDALRAAIAASPSSAGGA